MIRSLIAPALVLSAGIAVAAPLDFRETIESTQWTREDERTWMSPMVSAEAPFDEMIYSWSVPMEDGEGFRLYFRVGFGEQETSPWLYAGYWGVVSDKVSSRKNPEFEHGRVEMDQLLLEKSADRFQFQIVDSAGMGLSTMPRIDVVLTDNKAPGEPPPRVRPTVASPILDLPFRAQVDSQGNRTPDRCQTAAVATAMEFFGTSVGLEDLLPWTYDDEYDYPGIWPRTIGVARQHGYDGYIDRFRGWESARAAIEEGKVILCSINPRRSLNLQAPPYGPIGGHIVALNGFTGDGRVVTTDSALSKDGKGTLCQWLMEDFEKVWFDTKGGVGMVIVPPPGFEPKLVAEIPPFPMEQRMEEKAKRAAEEAAKKAAAEAAAAAEKAETNYQ